MEARSCDDSEAVVRSDRDVGQDGGSGDGEVSMKRCFEGRIDRIWRLTGCGR